MSSLEHAVRVHGFLARHFEAVDLPPGQTRLFESMRYSLLQEGGKRFRPVLALLTAEALGSPAENALPFAAAVECVHTYSLIHDDLPAMDNDDFRRGQPTNHKAFDEATAILSGDALLTEAFQLVADAYGEKDPAVAVRLISELAKASGASGMVGGQAIDIGAKTTFLTLESLRVMHQLKTGALIRVAAVGAAVIAKASAARQAEIASFAENLGLAFQVADDLLDFDPAKPEAGSYPTLLGAKEAKAFLDQLTATCIESLKTWPETAEPLREIARYNRDRQR